MLAAFLNGKYAFHAFELEIQHEWKGLAVPATEIIVDVQSAFDAEANWPALGAIVLGPEGPLLQVTMKERGGFC